MTADDEVPRTPQDAIRRSLYTFGLPVGIIMAVLDLADGGLGEIAQGGAAVVVRKVVVGVVSAMVATMLFGLFHYYASRWLRGDDRTD